MTSRVVALALVVLLPSVALADGFAIELAGRELGREAIAGDGSSTAALQVVPGGEAFRYEQRTEVDEAGAFARYTLSSNVHDLVAEVTSSGVTITGTVAGNANEQRLPPPPAGASWLVLDNFVFAHYDLLGRAMLGVTTERAFHALIPQAFAAVPATCRPAAETTVRVNGAERPARLLRLTLANVLVEATVDRETGRAYVVRVPGQRLSAVRDGVAQAEGPPPAPAPVAPCREEQVTFPSPWGDVPGTLALPAAGEGPWPVVLFLHGSGPNDRDETIGPNKPLRDLAWQLAQHGVASLRYDKRTFLMRSAEPARVKEALKTLTLEHEYVEDGLAALAWLATRPEVREDARFVAGHSLGAVVAPAVARGGGARGVAVLAGPGRRIDALLGEQGTYQRTLAGMSPEEAERETRALLSPLRDGTLADDAPFLGANGRYWKDVQAHDPVALLAALELPVLLLHAEADCQVRVADHEALSAGLQAKGRAFEAHLFPRLNHLFMRVDGRSTGAEYSIPGRVDPAVGVTLASWVRAQSPAR